MIPKRRSPLVLPDDDRYPKDQPHLPSDPWGEPDDE